MDLVGSISFESSDGDPSGLANISLDTPGERGHEGRDSRRGLFRGVTELTRLASNGSGSLLLY